MLCDIGKLSDKSAAQVLEGVSGGVGGRRHRPGGGLPARQASLSFCCFYEIGTIKLSSLISKLCVISISKGQ